MGPGGDDGEVTDPFPLEPGGGAGDAGGLGGTAGDVNGAGASLPDSGPAPDLSCTLAFEFASEGGSSCYRFSGDVAAWPQAQAECQRWGGDLVSIESVEEDLFLGQRTAGNNVWIGANDIEAEGVMAWPSGAPFSYTNWQSTQPDNFMGLEDCVEKRSAGVWNDRVCEGNPLRFVCER